MPIINEFEAGVRDTFLLKRSEAMRLLDNKLLQIKARGDYSSKRLQHERDHLIAQITAQAVAEAVDDFTDAIRLSF